MCFENKLRVRFRVWVRVMVRVRVRGTRVRGVRVRGTRVRVCVCVRVSGSTYTLLPLLSLH